MEELIQRLLDEGKMLRILPRHRVYLEWYNAGDGPRFTRLFREAWQRLPLSVRRRILRHWHTNIYADYCPIPYPGVSYSPKIELMNSWEDRYGGTRLRGDWAAVGANGHHMLFFAPIVDRMPEEIVQDLVAHELAHVYQAAIGFRQTKGNRGHLMYTDGNGSSLLPGELEDYADCLVVAWGFSDDAMDVWASEQWPRRKREVTLEEIIRRVDRFMRTGRR